MIENKRLGHANDCVNISISRGKVYWFRENDATTSWHISILSLSLFFTISRCNGEQRINCDKTIGRASALLEGIAVHETCAPAPRDASKVDKPQRSPCDAVTNATEIAPPGENQPRFDTFVREKHGRCSPLFTIDKGTLESAIAIVPRYIPAISQTQHEHTVTQNVYARRLRFESHCKSKLPDAKFTTNNCPDTGRNNMGTEEDHDRPISPRVFVEYFYLP